MSGRHILTTRQFNELTVLLGYKWVRLTNEAECHNGFQFKTGPNVDTKPFNTETDQDDGLYFCLEEDTFHWIQAAKLYIRDVIIPESANDFVVIDFNKHQAKARCLMLGEKTDIWTSSFCKQVVEKNGLALSSVPLAKRTYELCKVAVQNNGLALCYVPPEHQTDELCKLAVQQNGMALQYAPLKMRTAEVRNLAYQKSGDKVYDFVLQSNIDHWSGFDVPQNKRAPGSCIIL